MPAEMTEREKALGAISYDLGLREGSRDTYRMIAGLLRLSFPGSRVAAITVETLEKLAVSQDAEAKKYRDRLVELLDGP